MGGSPRGVGRWRYIFWQCVVGHATVQQPTLFDRPSRSTRAWHGQSSVLLHRSATQPSWQGKPGARVQQFQGHFQGGKNMRSCKGDGPSNQMGMEMKRASVTCASSQSLVSLLAGACDGLQD